MDTKQIVEKALKGEDYSTDIASFTDEQKTQLNLQIRDAATAAAKAELDKVTGLRKESERLEKKPEMIQDESVKQFKAEQKQEALDKFFTEFEIKTEEDKAKYLSFAENSQAVGSKAIFDALKREFAANNADTLIQGTKKVAELEKNAAEFMAGQTGGTSNGGTPDDSKYSETAKNLYKDWQKNGVKDKTLDDAQKLVDRGTDWRNRNIA